MHSQYSWHGSRIKSKSGDGDASTFDVAGVLFNRLTGAVYAHGDKDAVIEATQRMNDSMAAVGQIAELQKMQLIVDRIDPDELNSISSIPGYVLSWWARESFIKAARREVIRTETGKYFHAGYDVRSDRYTDAADHLCMVIVSEAMEFHKLSAADWQKRDFVARLKLIAETAKAHATNLKGMGC